MPVVVAIAIRYIIMAAVQLGIWTLIEKYGLPLLNRAIQEVIEAFGVSEEDAQAFMGNKILLAFESVGVFAVTLRTKLPIKVAERLGFTSKGYVIRKLSLAGEAKLGGAVINTTKGAIATTAEVTSIANYLAPRIGVPFQLIGSLWKLILNNVSASAVIILALANVMDFGNWNGAYQRTFQKIFTALGFPPDNPMPKANTLSPDVWKRIYSTIEELKPLGISFPFSGIDKPYSRQNLADMIDELTANLIKNGDKYAFKDVIGLALPLIQLSSFPNDVTAREKFLSTSSVTTTSTNTTVSVAPIVKVFTGIVSQGVVGEGLVFTPRPDDLIESAEELRQAAANNLAPFLNSLLGKIVYEVKVVSSIITKEGFRQSGQSQRIQTGTYQNGQPKYKTVRNKFATLVVYALTDKGSRAKITTIVLGPTDSAKLTVATDDLRGLEKELPSLVTTTDVSEITGITTPVPVTVSTTPQITQTPTTTPTPVVSNELQYYVKIDNGIRTYYKFPKIEGARGNGYIEITKEAFYQLTGASVPATTPVVTPASSNPVKPGANASTLYEWYQAQGQALPSMQARSLIYAGFGLGQASFYTGTSEQNTKLLNALKST